MALGMIFARSAGLPVLPFLLSSAVLLAGALLAASFGRERRAWILGFAAAAAIGAARVSLSPARPSAAPELGRRNTVVEGVVDEEPAVSVSRSTTVFILRAERLRPARGRWEAFRGRVRVKLQWADHETRYGDRVRIKGTLFPPSGPSNPGQSDFVKAMDRRGVGSLVSVWKPGDVLKIGSNAGGRLRSALISVRREAGEIIRKLVGPPESELLASIVFGIKSGDFSDELLDAYRATGLMHILVASGLNVGLLAWLALSLFGAAGIGRGKAAALTVPILGAYLLICGAEPPLLRSTLMFTLIVAAQARGRRGAPVNAMGLSALLIIMISPESLWDRSFQFSFAATFSILMLVPWFTARRGPVPKIVAETAACTIAAQMALFPFLAHSFGSVPFLGLFANLLVAPFMAVFLAGGILLLLLGWIPALGIPLGLALGASLTLVTAAVSAFARLPLAMVVSPPLSPAALAAYLAWYAGLIGWTVPRPAGMPLPLWPRASALLGAGVMAALAWAAALAPPPGNLSAAFLDVGEGLGIVVRLPSGRALLVDAGTDFAGGAVVSPFLKSTGIGRLAGIVLTHPHADHCGGLRAVMRMTKPDFVLITGARSENPAGMRETLGYLSRDGIPCRIAAAGTRIEGEPGVSVEFLSPPRGFLSGTSKAHFTDENSAVLAFRYGATTLLVTGDIKSRAERLLAESVEPPPGLLLQVPHHGSAYASTRRFLSAFAPLAAVAACGAGNRFGHPRPAVVLRYRDHGVLLRRTDLDGAVLAVSDGKAWRLSSFGRPSRDEGPQSPPNRAENGSARCERWKGKI